MLQRIGESGIDGDTVAYRAAAIAEPTMYDIVVNDIVLTTLRYKTEADAYVAAQPEDKQHLFEIKPWKKLEPVEHACQIAKTMMIGILDAVGSVNYRLFLTSQDKSNFRYEVAKTKGYKEGRPPKPTHLPAVMDYMVNRWKAEWVHGEEADDALGKFQYDRAMRLLDSREDSCYEVKDVTCIVTNDKDLKQIPGLHYNFVTKEFDFVTPEQGDDKLYEQILTGDSVDNIPGCRGIGPVKAKEILAKCKTSEEKQDAVIQTYKQKYGVDDWEDMYNEQRALVEIRRC